MSLQLGTDPEAKTPVELPEDALLRHVVILGATGAGKTVFAKAFLEEAVRAGVPVIAVDAQGDLASLALAHTDAAATEDLVVAIDALAESLAGAMGYNPAAETSGRAKDVLFLTSQSCLKGGR